MSRPLCLAATLVLWLLATGCGDDRDPGPARAPLPGTGPVPPLRERTPEPPDLSRFVGRWDAEAIWGADGATPPDEPQVFWLELREDGRFTCETMVLPAEEDADGATAAHRWRRVAVHAAVSDRLGTRVSSRGLWTAVWEPARAEVTLRLRFDPPPALRRFDETAADGDGDTDAGAADAEAERELSLLATLVGQRGRYMRLAGHPTRLDVRRMLLRREE